MTLPLTRDYMAVAEAKYRALGPGLRLKRPSGHGPMANSLETFSLEGEGYGAL